MKSTTRLPLALAVCVLAAPALAFLAVRATASPLLTDPYPPLGWSERSFEGVVSSSPPPRGVKARWITIRRPDGSEVQSPLDVHNKLPRSGEVRKRAGEFDLEVRDDPSAPWLIVTPSDGSQRDVQLLLQWLAWSAGSFTFLAALSLALFRRPKPGPETPAP